MGLTSTYDYSIIHKLLLKPTQHHFLFTAGKSAEMALLEINKQKDARQPVERSPESREMRAFKAMISDPKYKEKYVKVLRELIKQSLHIHKQ